jgi:hypothetical protein
MKFTCRRRIDTSCIIFLLSGLIAAQERIILSVIAFGLQKHNPLTMGTISTTASTGPDSVIDKELVPVNDKKSTSNHQQRRQFLLDCCISSVATTSILSWSLFPELCNAKLYSENAKNLERINSGDFSGGSIYDNNPRNEKGRKRRAMAGCKVNVAREEASYTILKQQRLLSEKDCNTMVLSGESEFMLQALQNLNCPTCPNGISPTRDTSTSSATFN